MKQFLHILKAARKLEILAAIAAVSVLLVLWMGEGGLSGGTASEEEKRMQRILSQIDGAGRVSVMISGSEDKCTGVVVASSGAEDMVAVLQIQRAVQTLTGLELDRIEVVKSR